MASSLPMPHKFAGDTKLHALVSYGFISDDILATALKSGTFAPNARNQAGQTPLHLAVQCAYFRGIDLLIAAHANASLADGRGRTPMHIAAMLPRYAPETVSRLWDAGSEVNTADREGYTPLHLAAATDNGPCVAALLYYGAAADAETSCGERPIHLAASSGGLDAAKTLIGAGAGLDTGDGEGMTPAALADRVGNTALVKLLRASLKQQEQAYRSQPSSSQPPVPFPGTGRQLAPPVPTFGPGPGTWPVVQAQGGTAAWVGSPALTSPQPPPPRGTISAGYADPGWSSYDSEGMGRDSGASVAMGSREHPAREDARFTTPSSAVSPQKRLGVGVGYGTDPEGTDMRSGSGLGQRFYTPVPDMSSSPPIPVVAAPPGHSLGRRPSRLGPGGGGERPHPPPPPTTNVMHVQGFLAEASATKASSIPPFEQLQGGDEAPVSATVAAIFGPNQALNSKESAAAAARVSASSALPRPGSRAGGGARVSASASTAIQHAVSPAVPEIGYGLGLQRSVGHVHAPIHVQSQFPAALVQAGRDGAGHVFPPTVPFHDPFSAPRLAASRESVREEEYRHGEGFGMGMSSAYITHAPPHAPELPACTARPTPRRDVLFTMPDFSMGMDRDGSPHSGSGSAVMSPGLNGPAVAVLASSTGHSAFTPKTPTPTSPTGAWPFAGLVGRPLGVEIGVGVRLEGEEDRGLQAGLTEVGRQATKTETDADAVCDERAHVADNPCAKMSTAENRSRWISEIPTDTLDQSASGQEQVAERTEGCTPTLAPAEQTAVVAQEQQMRVVAQLRIAASEINSLKAELDMQGRRHKAQMDALRRSHANELSRQEARHDAEIASMQQATAQYRGNTGGEGKVYKQAAESGQRRRFGTLTPEILADEGTSAGQMGRVYPPQTAPQRPPATGTHVWAFPGEPGEEVGQRVGKGHSVTGAEFTRTIDADRPDRSMEIWSRFFENASGWGSGPGTGEGGERSGLSTSLADDDGGSAARALIQAVVAGNAPAVVSLLLSGASPSALVSIPWPGSLVRGGHCGYPCLMLDMVEGGEGGGESGERLVLRLVDPGERVLCNAIHASVAAGRSSLLPTLVEATPEGAIEVQDYWGATPVLLAAALAVGLARGIDVVRTPTPPSLFGHPKSALEIPHGAVPCLQWLLEAAADVTVSQKDGCGMGHLRMRMDRVQEGEEGDIVRGLLQQYARNATVCTWATE